MLKVACDGTWARHWRPQSQLWNSSHVLRCLAAHPSHPPPTGSFLLPQRRPDGLPQQRHLSTQHFPNSIASSSEPDPGLGCFLETS